MNNRDLLLETVNGLAQHIGALWQYLYHTNAIIRLEGDRVRVMDGDKVALEFYAVWIEEEQRWELIGSWWAGKPIESARPTPYIDPNHLPG